VPVHRGVAPDHPGNLARCRRRAPADAHERASGENSFAGGSRGCAGPAWAIPVVRCESRNNSWRCVPTPPSFEPGQAVEAEDALESVALYRCNAGDGVARGCHRHRHRWRSGRTQHSIELGRSTICICLAGYVIYSWLAAHLEKTDLRVKSMPRSREELERTLLSNPFSAELRSELCAVAG